MSHIKSKWIRKLFGILLLLAGVQYSQQTKSLKLSLYYEALCPDCMDFWTEQLTPLFGAFNKYPDWLIFDPIPFGNAKETGKYQFTCQHGPKECMANMMHACAIDQLVTRQQNPLFMRLVNFIYCLFNKQDQIKGARLCAAQTSVDYHDLMKCYKSDKGKELMEMYANRTAALQPPLSWVPTIVYNDKFNQTASDKAQSDLYDTTCGYVPDQCL